MRGLKRLHPVTAALYLALMLCLTMIRPHPIISAVMLIYGMVLYALMAGGRRFLRTLPFCLVIMVLVTVTNPLFVHRGATVLFYINKSPFTLEALICGAASSMLLGGVYYWFACLGEVMDDDKTVCLLGGRFPRTALLLSMTLGLVPRLARTAVDIDDTQRALGVQTGDGMYAKIRAKLSVFSVLVSQSLEGSIDTADSMAARGYTLPGRKSYRRYRFTAADVAMCIFTAAAAAVAITGLVLTEGYSFYPVLTAIGTGKYDIMLYTAAALGPLAAIISEVREKVRWRCLKQKI